MIAQLHELVSIATDRVIIDFRYSHGHGFTGSKRRLIQRAPLLSIQSPRLNQSSSRDFHRHVLIRGRAEGNLAAAVTPRIRAIGRVIYSAARRFHFQFESSRHRPALLAEYRSIDPRVQAGGAKLA